MRKDIDLKSKFLQVYDSIKSDLLHDPAFEFDDDSRQWVERMIDYNVPGGKMTRGLSVLDSYKLLKGESELTDDELFLACALGWCIEWMQGYIVLHDDIVDGSHIRRGQPCWFRIPEVNMIAVNDGALLSNHVRRILKKNFHGKAYYAHLLDLFNEVELQTIYGQMIDATTTNLLERKISQNILCFCNNRRIMQYKSSYYSFYLPVACALLLLGENPDDYV
ncbi:putative transferase [Helianthus annuus]|nr:putative transferase [Helianthus annuus]